MSWLRVDDGFSRHPKVTALSPKDRWTWLDILCYCARYNTAGYLPENIREFVSGATDRYLNRCVALELLDDDHDGIRVHDWQTYAPKDPTGAERQARWRRKGNAPRNADVTDEIVTEPSTSRAGAGARSRPDPSLSSSNGAVDADEQHLVSNLVDKSLKVVV